MTPQHRGFLSDTDRARIVAAIDARDTAERELRESVLQAARNGASVREMADSLDVSTNTISRWKREAVAAERES
ncbi:helix-turn-helix domain-containing protein [Microbacterium sp. NPDC078428]|uniref:helix-turn-helix domain-containing protein n=1 Tax=Microbacterium sp. NPDC078428 TaxID=3364190 RepID=UPI0037CA319C